MDLTRHYLHDDWTSCRSSYPQTFRLFWHRKSVYAFIADASQNQISIVQDGIACPTGYSVIYPGGINDNGQVSGYAEGGGPAAGFYFDAADCQDLSGAFSGGQGVAYGLNDFAQIVGQLEAADASDGVELSPINQ